MADTYSHNMMPATNQRPIEHVVDCLNAHQCKPKQSGTSGEWSSKCPVQANHKNGDKNPSLSIGEGPDGKVLLHCHAGCTTPDVARALGLGLRDLFPDRPMATIDGGRRIKATYDYFDVHGTLIYQVVRYEPKRFSQRQPDGRGGWTNSLGGITERPLYHAPQVAAAIAAGKPVWVVEGEKDAEALQWAVDGATTCNSGGAGQWRPEHTRALLGATEVQIIADADKPGMAHARSVQAELAAVGITAEVLLPPTGFNDVAEALGAGRTLDQFSNADADDTELADDDDRDGDWSSIDLVEIAQQIRSGDWEQTLPTVLEVAGGLPLFYSQRICQLFGESGGGKTWVALAAVAETVRNGLMAMFIDYEDHAAGIAERLVLLGLTDDEIGRVDYRNPSTGLGIGLETMEQRVDDNAYALVIIDSAGEAMASGSINPNADDEVALWFRKVKDILRVQGGPAVIVLDHVPKSTDAPSAYAIGSQRKRAAVNGAAYRVDTLKEPAKGRDGKLKLTVAKDRLGNRPKGSVAAEVDLISGEAGALSIALHLSEAQAAAAAGERFRPTVLMERVSRWLEVHPHSSQRAIRDEVEGRAQHIATALDVLLEEGFVRVVAGARGAQNHVVDNPFRESDDALAPHRFPVVPTGSRVVPGTGGDPLHRVVPTHPIPEGVGTTRWEPLDASEKKRVVPIEPDHSNVNEPVDNFDPESELF